MLGRREYLKKVYSLEAPVILGKRVDLTRVYKMDPAGGVGEEGGYEEGVLNGGCRGIGELV